MTTLEQPEMRTRLFARVQGPYFTIVPTMVAARGSYLQTLFTEFKANPMWPWLYGAILLMGGLVIIAFHQHWRTPAAIIVSVLGWFLALRGLLLMTVPLAYDAVGDAVYNSGATTAISVFFGFLAAAGLYLTYVGWRPERGATQDRPGVARR
jgi:hypothetical protein